MPDTIEIIANEMCVMDEDGNTHDVVRLTTYRNAKRQVDLWAKTHTIVIAEAYRQLADYFSTHHEVTR